MKSSNLFPVIFLLCCCFLRVGAQEYSYKHYEIKDGLAGNNVYQVAEDKEGFLWFATETGVSRFDGTSFVNFTTAQGLPDNEILKLFVDSKNRVWMMPFKNAVCYYYKGKLHNAANDTTIAKIQIDDRVLGITEDNDGNIYFFETFTMHLLLRDNRIIEKTDIPSNTVIYGAGVDNQQKPFVYFSRYPSPTLLYSIRIMRDSVKFIRANDSIKFYGNKWNTSYINQQLFVYMDNYKEFLDYSRLIFNNYIGHQSDTVQVPQSFNFISFLNDSICFFNTTHGAVEYDYKKHVYRDKFLDEENVSCTLEDKGKSIWFTTLGNGIFRLRSRINKNIILTHNNISNGVESVLIAADKILVGTENGKIFELLKGNDSVISVKELGGGKIIKMLQHENYIYILAEEALFQLDPLSGKIEQVSFFETPDAKYSLKDVVVSKGNEFFFASHVKVFSLSQAKRMTKNYIWQRSTSICPVNSGLYVGSLAGLKFMPWGKEVIDLGEKLPLLKSRITKILSIKNKIWIGTNDNGVICFDGNKIEKKISVENGLNSSLVRTLYADNKNLWVGTDMGLNKIDLSDTSNKIIQQYTISDGLLSNMINAVTVNNDTVYVGTPKGLSFFDDREMQSNSKCEMRILDITVSGRSLGYDSAKLNLKNRDNNIRFDFVALSYKSEGNITYYYQLSGIDTEWKTTKENFLLYPTLPSGNYDLELYAVNKFGIKSKPVTISFEIEKKLVEENWFITLLFLCFIGITAALVNWRIRGLKNVQQEKIANAAKISQLEQQALKAQMNPHFIFNCLNSIQQYVIDKDIQGANKFISGFSKLIRQTLDNSGKQSITVAEEESFLHAYLELEKSRFEDKFDYYITIDKNIRKEEDSLPPMLLQPYIENCVRHGIMHKSNGKGIIDVRFNLSDRKLICTVTDNGIGRMAADAFKGMQHINYQSRGTDLTLQRIMMLNKNNAADIVFKTEDLVDETHKPCGTRVTIVIPLQHTY